MSKILDGRRINALRQYPVMRDLIDSHEELRRQLAEAQGQLELEREKVEILVSEVGFCPERGYNLCNGDNFTSAEGHCSECWGNRLDAEAAKWMEERT